MAGKKTFCIYAIYILALFYLMFKAFFYSYEVDWGPDVAAHMSYTVYVWENPDKPIPDFKNMNMLEFEAEGDQAYVVGEFKDINYLGHPPLYYRLLVWAGCVKEIAGVIVISMKRILWCNVLMVSFGLLVCLEFGRRKIEKYGNQIVYHMLFVTIVVCLPMVSYLCGSPTNDNLLYLPVGMVLFGVDRGLEGNRGYGTYMLIALGVALGVLTKLTVGLILLVAVAITVVYVVVKEKSGKILLCLPFFSTLPVYVVPLLYFTALKSTYGVVQPSQGLLSAESAENSIWSFFQGENLSFGKSIQYFWTNFWHSWTTVYSEYMTLDKQGSTIRIVFWIFMVFFFIWLCINVWKLLRGKLSAENAALLNVGIGTIVAFLYQFRNSVLSYMKGGLSGFQSRYYVCCIAVFSLCCVMVFQSIVERHIKIQLCKIFCHGLLITYSLLLLYADFGYFLTHFAQYRDYL